MNEKLVQWRLDQCYTQQELADLLDCHRNTVWSWEKGGKIDSRRRQIWIHNFNIDPISEFDMEEKELYNLHKRLEKR